MTAPSSYSESELAQMMCDVLGQSGAAFGLNVPTAAPILFAVKRTERILSVSDVADVTDMQKLEVIAVWRAWVAALGAATNDKDIKAGTASLALSQRFQNIKELLALAEAEASVYPEAASVIAGMYTGAVSEMTTSGSPYNLTVWPEFS